MKTVVVVSGEVIVVVIVRVILLHISQTYTSDVSVPPVLEVGTLGAVYYRGVPQPQSSIVNRQS